MTREQLSSFQGENNVTKIVADNGSVSYLTPSISFADKTFALGATKLNTYEVGSKHVAFLFNSADAEVGRYYMGSKLHGLNPVEICEKKSNLVFFKSWNPAANNGAGAWVPCLGVSSQENLAATAVAF